MPTQSGDLRGKDMSTENTYCVYSYERHGEARQLMVLKSEISQYPVEDYIVSPDEVTNMTLEGEVVIETDIYMPESWEA
jgi:hypothetical protein